MNSDPSVSTSQQVVVVAPLDLVTTSVPNGTVGAEYPGTTLDATGGVSPLTWSITSGALPTGMSLDASTGALLGTPTVGGSFNFTVAVTDSEQSPVSVTQSLEIVVGSAPTSTSLSSSLATLPVGGTDTYTATVDAPVAPTGTVTFSDGGTPMSQCENTVISTTSPYVATCTATYDSAGTHTVTATYSGDGSTQASTSSVASVTVVPPFAITSTTLPSGAVGQPYPQTTLGTSGGLAPVTWFLASGSLPPGLSLDATTGFISGTPDATGTYPFTIGVTDSETQPATANTVVRDRDQLVPGPERRDDIAARRQRGPDIRSAAVRRRGDRTVQLVCGGR